MTLLPTRVPLLIEYRKGERLARSLVYVLAQADGLILAAATLDGRAPLGPVHIEERAITRCVRLSEGDRVEGVGGG